MALVIADSGGALVEFSAPESLNALLESQRELFHAQIEQLRRTVVEQCKLTGTNPLSQEMAAGALSIKIGKRPRDLLNPKAAKYIQSVFSIKDTVGKKETREISAICGITVSQVREYFAGQRSRVRKLVRLSREKASKSVTPKAAEDCLIKSTNDVVPVYVDSPINIVEPPIISSEVLVTGDHPQLNSCTGTIFPAKDDQQKVASIEATKKGEEAPSSSIQEESLPGIDSEDAKFLDSIINLMRKEKTFSGQVKLMEWILKIQNLAVLSSLLSKGGISILAAWLAEAAVEEQTTVLLLIIKVLCHLPLQEALPVQMSAILQAVNKLRFYRTTDISIRAKTLLAKWSKQFIRSQARKGSNANGSKNTSKDICEQSISDILSDDSWQSAADIPADILSLAGKTESSRKSKQALMLLPAPSPDSNKKNGQSVLVSKSRERRKVLLVEHPGRKASGRSIPVARAVPMNSSRPISADDIQKAKMRAIFMQNKHGKSDPSTGGNKTHNAEIRKVPCAPQTNNACTTAKSPLVTQEVNRDDKTLVSEAETTAASKQTLASKDDVVEKLRCSQIRWRMPPAVRIDPQWCMGVGQDSKEIQVQTQRNQREKETLYSGLQKIPPDPKEPWDREMDFDDSLTPEVPTEQPPDGDGAGNLSFSMPENGANTDEPSASTLVPLSAGNGVPEPDLELLAVLLKNPDLVFALTSNQASQLKSEDTIALLDLLKRNGNSLAELLNASEQSRNNVSQELKRHEPEPTSLPSPTPPSDVARVTAWRSEIPTRTNTPVLQPHFQRGDSVLSLSHGMPVTGPALPESVKGWGAGVALHEKSSTVSSLSQVTTVNPLRQNSVATSYLPNRSPTPTMPHPTFPTSQLLQQQTASDINLPIRRYSAANTRVPNSLLQQDSFSHSPLPVSSLSKHSHLTEQLAFTHMNNNKRPAGATNSTGGAWPDTKLDEWTGRNSDLLDAPASNQHHLSHPNRHLSSESSYDSYSHLTAHPSQPPHTSMAETGYRNVVANRSDMESWSLDGGPMRSSQLRAGRTYNNEPQSNGVWSRPWASGNQNAHWPGSGNRWPDRGRHRDNRGRR